MSFVTAALILGGAGAIGTIGSAAIGASSNGGQPDITDKFTHGPTFQTGVDATNNWWNTLQNWQNDPNYGAIAPDWNDIWSQTQQQVKNYFEGTATNPGVNDKIDSSFATRGMSGDPAAAFLQSQSGANEAQQLGNLSAQQNIAKNSFAEKGRTDWLNSLQALQNQTINSPSGGHWSGAVATPTPTQQIANAAGTAFSGIGSGALQFAGNQMQNNWLTSQLQNPTSYAPEIESAFL